MSPYFGDRTVFVNHEKCYKFQVVENKVIRTVEDDLSCPEHLEADTKIIFHICQLNFDAHVTIRCSDTDIIVIMLGNMHRITHNIQISILTGRANNHRYIDVTKIYQKLGNDLSKVLPAFHAFTGCNFNPAFYRKGKNKPYELLKKSRSYIDAFIAISEWSDNELSEHFAVLEGFVCQIYGYETLNDVNLPRLATFMKVYRIEDNETILKTKCIFEGSALPPCKSELYQHLLRTSYIAQMWTHASLKITSIASLTDYGWQEEDGRYTFKWFDGEQLHEIHDVTQDLSENLSDCQEDSKGDEGSSDYNDDDESSTEESDFQSDSDTD